MSLANKSSTAVRVIHGRLGFQINNACHPARPLINYFRTNWTPCGCQSGPFFRAFKTLSKCYLRGSYNTADDTDDWRRRRVRIQRIQTDEDSPTSLIDDQSKNARASSESTGMPTGKTIKKDNQSVQDAQPLSDQLPTPNKRILKSILEDAASFDKSKAQGEWSTPHYPASSEKLARSRLQGSHGPPPRPGLDPQDATVILFPGQGAQYSGMAKSLMGYPNVRQMFDVASEILGYDLRDICLNGTREDLSRTVYCQPATVVASLAALQKLKDESPHAVENCTATAGFSVGEITSLIFANALNFEDGMKLVRIRAEAMQAASEMTPGGMMTVFYGPSGRVEFACKAAREWCSREGIEDPVCSVANYLYPGCKVISGHEEALNFITRTAKDFRIDRYKHLRVSGAFHSRLMIPAMEVMVQALQKIRLNNPLISVYSNVDGRPYRSVTQIQRSLPKQLCTSVKWEQVQHALYERPVGSNYPQTYECGPGRALQTILQRVNAKAYARSHVIGA